MSAPATIASPADPTFVYIVGRGHSGSTMLELLLDRYPDVAAMGEIDMMALQIYREQHTRWVGLCSCGERPDRCPVWREVLGHIASEYGADLMKKPFSWRISDVGVEEEFGWRSPLAQIGYKTHRLIRSIAYRGTGSSAGPFTATYRQWIRNRDAVARRYAALAKARIVVDASKDPLQMRDIVAHSSLPVKILFLTRDVRGLAWSALRKQVHSVETSAKEWVALNRRTMELLNGIPREQWLHVRYEDICGRTEQELSRIADFIGAGNEPVLAPAQEFARRHTIAGNSIRFKELSAIREDQAWQKNLTPEQLQAIMQIAGPLSRELGYTIQGD